MCESPNLLPPTDGVHNDTAAIRNALAAAGAAGGGLVLLPAPHTFLSGSLHMQNHTTFRVIEHALQNAHDQWHGTAGTALHCHSTAPRRPLSHVF